MNTPTSSAKVIQDEETDMEQKENKEVIMPPLWEKIATWTTHYLHISAPVKIWYYAITMLLLSLVQDFVDVPHLEELTGKRSFFNMIVVKQGWGLTFLVIILYWLVSLSLHTNWLAGLRRLAVWAATTTFVFYIWCAVIFEVIEQSTAACTHRNIVTGLSKKECYLRDDHVYHSFNISGHSFLLTYNVLLLMEESKEILRFLGLGRRFSRTSTENGTGKDSLAKLDKAEMHRLRLRCITMAPLIALGIVMVGVLALLWDFMLIVTSIYYHTFWEKLIGTSLAFAMWYVLYKKIFLCLFKWDIFLV